MGESVFLNYSQGETGGFGWHSTGFGTATLASLTYLMQLDK